MCSRMFSLGVPLYFFSSCRISCMVSSPGFVLTPCIIPIVSMYSPPSPVFLQVSLYFPKAHRASRVLELVKRGPGGLLLKLPVIRKVSALYCERQKLGRAEEPHVFGEAGECGELPFVY